MSAIISIRMGEDLEFSFSRQGLPLTGLICTIFVKQYPKDSPAITREIPINPQNPLIWSGQLSSTETAALKVGLWWIVGIITDDESDEEAQDPIRFQVSPSWN
jgi:hypothetical protein